MIPSLVALAGAPWRVLPPGIHCSTFLEVEGAFAFNYPRREFYAGLLKAGARLHFAGCGSIYLDGSYVTSKPIPGDYDACWDPVGVDPAKLDPVFKDFSNKRAAQKKEFGGEFFPATAPNAPNQSFVEFFQVERYTGLGKGILLINLTKDPTLLRRIQS